jgi:hypothetical protein
MRNVLLITWLLLCSITPATAQVSFSIDLPGVSIGINQPVYPNLVRVPGYPVYYAPSLRSNYFYYDGMFWVYQRDNWYASFWYNGPWGLVSPEAVPLYILRVPVRYYRQPPTYFRGWRPDAPPRWGEHWGTSWQQSRGGWDSWDRSAVPSPAPLPVYQRQYAGSRYPRFEQQQVLQTQNYRYQPHDAVVQQQYQALRAQAVQPAVPQQQPQQAAPKQNVRKPQQPAPQQSLQQPQHAAPQQPQHAAPQRPQHAAPQQPVQQPQRAAPQQRVQQPQEAVPQPQQAAPQQKARKPAQPAPQQPQQAAPQQKAQKPQQAVPQPQAHEPQQGVPQQRGQQPPQPAPQQKAQKPQQAAPQQQAPQSQQAPAQHAPKSAKQSSEKDDKPGGERNK